MCPCPGTRMSSVFWKHTALQRKQLDQRDRVLLRLTFLRKLSLESKFTLIVVLEIYCFTDLSGNNILTSAVRTKGRRWAKYMVLNTYWGFSVFTNLCFELILISVFTGLDRSHKHGPTEHSNVERPYWRNSKVRLHFFRNLIIDIWLKIGMICSRRTTKPLQLNTNGNPFEFATVEELERR